VYRSLSRMPSTCDTDIGRHKESRVVERHFVTGMGFRKLSMSVILSFRKLTLSVYLEFP